MAPGLRGMCALERRVTAVPCRTGPVARRGTCPVRRTNGVRARVLLMELQHCRKAPCMHAALNNSLCCQALSIADGCVAVCTRRTGGANRVWRFTAGLMLSGTHLHQDGRYAGTARHPPGCTAIQRANPVPAALQHRPMVVTVGPLHFACCSRAAATCFFTCHCCVVAVAGEPSHLLPDDALGAC